MRGLHWKRSENAPTGGEDEFEVGPDLDIDRFSPRQYFRPFCSGFEFPALLWSA